MFSVLLIAFVVIVVIVVIRYGIKLLSTQDEVKRTSRRMAVEERFRAAAEQLSRRGSSPPPPGYLPAPGAQPTVAPMAAPQAAPIPPPTPVAPARPVDPPAMLRDSADSDTALTSSLDSSLSTTLGTSPDPTGNPAVTGPQVVPLSPELERRVTELMEQNYEVMAVRLLCDELHVGILDAQKTVRTLMGLPTTY